jgi:hypothetical protein
MIRQVWVAGLVVAMAGSTGSCGQPRSSAELRAASASTAAQPPARPEINWDHPLVSGLKSDAAGARAAGRLSFAPVVPRFDVAETAVEVSDPGVDGGLRGSVAFIYDFPPGKDFPAGGRVVVIEGPTTTTEADIPRIVKSNGPEHFRAVTVGGRQALLIEADGVGRVRVFRDGIVIDVTGPATPPDTVVALADALG